jgi:hypothetical protein
MSVASRRAWRAGLFALAILAAHSSLASGSPPVNLRSLAQRAGTIVTGRIVQVRPGTHPAYPRVGVTYVTLRVTEAFKGAAPGDFTFMQFGHAGDTLPPVGQANFFLVQDLPAYHPGEEVLLFLYPPSDAGLTSPVDGARGKWPLARDSTTGRIQVVGLTLSPSPGAGASQFRNGTDYGRVRASLRRLTGSSAPAKKIGTAPRGASGGVQ